MGAPGGDAHSEKDPDAQIERNLHSRVFPWIDADHSTKKDKDGFISIDDIVNRGVPRDELQKHVSAEMQETANFTSLPFTLFFCASYATMVIVHDDAKTIRAVEESISFDVTAYGLYAKENEWVGFKSFYDVNSLGDFYSWARNGLFPIVFEQVYDLSEQDWNYSDVSIQSAIRRYAPQDRGILLNYNKIIGGVRFQQERATSTTCSAAVDGLNLFYGASCTGTAYETDPESWPARVTTNPQKVKWFYVREERAVMDDRLLVMEANGWGDRFTKKIEVSVPVYNAEFGLHSLIYFNFFFSRGGRIWKQVIPLSSYSQWYTQTHYAAFDSVWFCCILWMLKTELLEVRSKLVHKGWKTLLTDYFNFWNIVDWCTIVGGLVVATLAMLTYNSTATVASAAIELTGMSFNEDPDSFNSQIDTYMEALEYLVHYVIILKLVLSFYPLILILRLFKAFAAQPRLAFVTRTIVITGNDLVHFMLVFTSIFMTFAMSGLMLFGRKLPNFTTLMRSANTVFRVMLGEFDWQSIREVSQVEGALWLICTLTVMNLLMLNMVLAIVMDGYTVVKNMTGNAETLPEEIVQIAKNWWAVKRGHSVPLRVIHAALETLAQGVSSRKETLKLKAAGVEVGAEILVGRDTKAVLGMRVEPTDEEVAHYLGPGVIVEVGLNHLVCRVTHDRSDPPGKKDEYEIGYGQNYELKLCEGEVPQQLGEADEYFQTLQLITPESLQKVVQTIGHTLSHVQAIQLLQETVNKYHIANSEGVDKDNLRMLLRKVKFRLTKITGFINEESVGGTNMHATATNDIHKLGRFCDKFYRSVARDRRKGHQDIIQLEHDIGDCRQRILRIRPEELEKLMARSAAKAVCAEFRIVDSPVRDTTTASDGSSQSSGSQLLDLVNRATEIQSRSSTGHLSRGKARNQKNALDDGRGAFSPGGSHTSLSLVSEPAVTGGEKSKEIRKLEEQMNKLRDMVMSRNAEAQFEKVSWELGEVDDDPTPNAPWGDSQALWTCG